MATVTALTTLKDRPKTLSSLLISYAFSKYTEAKINGEYAVYECPFCHKTYQRRMSNFIDHIYTCNQDLEWCDCDFDSLNHSDFYRVYKCSKCERIITIPRRKY